MDERTRREIHKVVRKTLKDAGLTEPPVEVGDLLQHLEVHRDFYDLGDASLLRRFWHKVEVGKDKLIRIVNKIRLAAVWLPDEKQILVDTSLPSPKKEWASFHDSTHRILEWHRSFFLGDTAQTLDPDFQEMLENEANYGASALMSPEKLSLKTLWTPQVIGRASKSYGKNIKNLWLPPSAVMLNLD